MIIETERLILRKPQARDWQATWAFYQSERSKGFGGPFGLHEAWRHFAYEIGHWEIRGYGMFTVTMKGADTALGIVGPWFPEDWPEPEIGWSVFDGAEGKGIAFEAATAAIDFARNTLGWSSFVSYISPDNTRSAALAKRLGAAFDPNAPRPHGEPLEKVHVYRHPKVKAHDYV